MIFPKRKNIKDQERQNLVIVGSRNPIKISCTESGFHQMFESAFLVEGLNVSSDIEAQPVGDKKTLTGAMNRAKNSKAIFPEADYWVGIEGGVEEFNDEMNAFAWVVILDRDGKVGKARTSAFFLPDPIAKLVRSGMELGEADDKFFQKENSKEGEGAVGILTNGVLDRKNYYQQAVVLALIPFVNDNIYH
ncbi:inosine/xanthosine triphosphatase [Aquiflexum balticum DSM 16537]|uniref:Probable inosine/xanthosine triphosphatase n=1 Tax=Aquiflexum balticum DSM 16537 TaxID=758820 RepID=A0A1W2H1U9_9BACT|nr:inosine/xanthosine triphosphatase [Aquiflexum balticum]SMD42592.1 inosine/xanthosine triphosphatase [Aquiflexum balticum DSM 16537]